MSESNEDRLRGLGTLLPAAPSPVANYVPFAIAGNLLFLSGQGPRSATDQWQIGKVGGDVTPEEAYGHAHLAGLQLLSVARSALGTLNQVKRVVKLLGLVNAVPSFTAHPQVINGCSDLMVRVFGESGRHARSAIGVSSLPRNMTVEIEAILEISQIRALWRCAPCRFRASKEDGGFFGLKSYTENTPTMMASLIVGRGGSRPLSIEGC
jgi:enamine deaminase RidA (YjgF/YER057c/UK114 family)